MTSLRSAADEFLSSRRIAVTGVSRTSQGHGGNVVYTRLRDRGYDVFAVNPNADTVEGDRSYPDLRSIEGGVDAVVIATRPEQAAATVRECIDLGVHHVWMHRSLGAGSVDAAAARWGHKAGLTVIEGGCPLMFNPVSDPAHKVIRFVCRCARTLPSAV
jgi:predicted CoA-binding protein